jgi:C1A family cysteine protease
MICLILFACIAYSHALSFSAWQSKFNKHYGTVAEQLYRRAVYISNARYVQEHSDVAELNEFADMTNDEFIKTHIGKDYEVDVGTTNETKPHSTLKTAPTSLDYRKYMNTAKDQGNCGSCWSFCTTSVIEAVVNIKKGVLNRFSEQQLIDCDSSNNGCDGGHPQNAFQFIKKNNGLTLESTYPYEEKQGTCKKVTNEYTITNYKRVTDGDEDNLKDLLNNYGPIAIGMDASTISFQLYKKGTIFSDDNCKKLVLNHCVTLVGYGSNADGDYWIVRNSWGTSWGDNGYFLLARNKNNMCGIARDSNYVTGVSEI